MATVSSFEHVAAVVDDAVLAMRRIRVQRNVGDHREFRNPLLDRCDRSLHQPVGIRALGTIRGFPAGVDDGKQRYRGDAQVARLRQFGEQSVHAVAPNSRHRRDRLAAVFAIQHENRVYKVVNGESVLADKSPQRRRASAAAQSN